MEVPTGFFVHWFKIRGRSFPWRGDDVSPFGILLAEVLLKQTKAEMVATVWPELNREYPTAASLECASPEALHQHISCLGFGQQRVTALCQLSVAINSAGGLPSEPEDLMKLPHIGIYSAHAIACFAFGHPVPIVDLSIVRVLSRLSGIEPATDIRRAPKVWAIAQTLLPEAEVKEHNYGLLDFAADICKARSPRCDECPIACNCAYAMNLAHIDKSDDSYPDLWWKP